MVSRFARSIGVALVTATLIAPSILHAGLHNYALGDVAQEDIATPLALEVVNPEATAALKRKEAEKVPLIFRFNPRSADEAEASLRAAFAAARTNFLAALRRTMKDKPGDDHDTGSSLFDRAVESARRQMNGFPLLDELAPVWSRNGSDEEMQAVMGRVLRKVLKSPVLAQKVDGFTAQDSGWLIPVDSLTVAPTPADAEQRHSLIQGSQVLPLSQARHMVRTNLPAELAITGPYLALLVRPNIQPDPDLTELIRAQRTDHLAALDDYDAAELVVRRGQVIDRKAMAALAALREKTAIGSLQQEIAQEQLVAAERRRQTEWILAISAFVMVLLGAALWQMRLRWRRLSPQVSTHAVLLAEAPDDAAWRARALTAESRADRAQEALRSGMLHWMHDKLVRGLFLQRQELLSAQQDAEMEMRLLEQRLQQLHAPLQQRIATYEQRIVELERELAAKGEENRDLIKARISLVRHQLAQERNRNDSFGSN